ncbi:hypothetical protein [Demetria terragena]|uniref:hypothetical protein n=1 Tax=Demetria terragena TaxID=63959 RepID=UPI000376A8D5|nr:hypothetical protein [Demetria terragena]
MSNESFDPDVTLADRLAESVRDVPSVLDLHGGVMGEVGTYLPGRRISGIREYDDRWEIHVTARLGYPLAEVSRQVRDAASAHVPGVPIDVVIEDLGSDDDRE